MEVPYLAIKIVSQYSPLLISTLHLAFPFALSQRKYFQQNAFLLLETSSNWSSLNMEIESLPSAPAPDPEAPANESSKSCPSPYCANPSKSSPSPKSSAPSSPPC